MATRRWRDLSPRTRRWIVRGALTEGLLKVAALVDLKRRSPEQVNGSRWVWALVLVLVNSLGLAPIGYFVFGRRGAQNGAFADSVCDSRTGR